MASRTISQIFDEMITEKETFSSLDDLAPNPDTAQTFLADLTSGSKVGIWRLILWVCAFGIWTFEQLFDVHVTDIEKAALAVQPGTLPWYAGEAKLFQDGFSLVFNDTTRKFEYADTTSTDAVAAKIIKHSSSRDISGVVTTKIAKVTATVTEKLTAAQLASFNVYWEKIKIAGTSTLNISNDPDNLKLGLTVEYDPQLLTSAGVLISDGVTKPIQVAIDDYVSVDSDSVQGLPFDALFRVQNLIDSIQGATGVVNVIADTVEASHGVVVYTDVLAVQTETYTPNAGYLATVDETGSESAPVIGDINDVSLDDDFIGVYATTGQAYSTNDFVSFNDGNAIKFYKANQNISADAGTFDTSEWDVVASITYVSV